MRSLLLYILHDRHGVPTLPGQVNKFIHSLQRVGLALRTFWRQVPENELSSLSFVIFHGTLNSASVKLQQYQLFNAAQCEAQCLGANEILLFQFYKMKSRPTELMAFESGGGQ